MHCETIGYESVLCVLISALFILSGSGNTVDESFASQLGTRVIVLVQLGYRKHLIAARSSADV